MSPSNYALVSASRMTRLDRLVVATKVWIAVLVQRHLRGAKTGK